MRVLRLGRTWSANSINVTIFRHYAIVTVRKFQFFAFYRSKTKIRIFRRNLETEELQVFDLIGDYNLKDAHNSISLGLDRSGFLHICYDHHCSELHYRRSKHPFDIYEWSDESLMSGQNESMVTYPTFLMTHNDNSLLLLYRDGNWMCGSARLKIFLEEEQTWHEKDTAILSGNKHEPWTSNPYWNRPAIDSKGNIYLSFVWRSKYSDEDQTINNSNIDFACLTSDTKFCYSSLGRKLQLPITQVNSETILAVAAGSNLINQTSMALDSNNFPHIAFYSNDFNSIPQYQHLWFDGLQWKRSFISNRKEKFDLLGGGTLQLPMSRPEILIDKDNIVYILYRGDLTDDKIVAQILLPPLYTPNPSNKIVLWSDPVGNYEPIVDHLRWNEQCMLTIYIQYCEQPNHDESSSSSFSHSYLVDFDLVKFARSKFLSESKA